MRHQDKPKTQAQVQRAEKKARTRIAACMARLRAMDPELAQHVQPATNERQLEMDFSAGRGGRT